MERGTDMDKLDKIVYLDKVPIRPDRQYILFYQAYYIWRRFLVAKPDKIVACIKCNSKINLIFMFPAVFFDYGMLCYDGTEIIQDQPCPYFLSNVFTFF